MKKVARKRSSADLPVAPTRSTQTARRAASKGSTPKARPIKPERATETASRTSITKASLPSAANPKAAVSKAASHRVATVKSRAAKGSAAPNTIRQGSTSVLMPLHEGIVYGPIRSRRLGRSLGINLTPAHLKLCSFNCSYCQYGWSDQSRRTPAPAFEHWPSPATVAKAVGVALKTLAAQGDHVERLTLAGHGEPTMHPKFKDVVAALRKVRDELAPGVPLAVLSNASTLERADVREALAELDERYMKLDAGDTTTLRSVNGTTLSIEQLVAGLKKVPDIVIQSMFVKDRTGRVDNTGDLTVINWVGALDRIRPKAVQVYTIDRAPAFPYLQQVAPARLREIVQRVRLAGFPCDVFGIPETGPAAAKP